MRAFTREEAAAKIGKRVRSMVDIAGVTSILVGTVIRADASTMETSSAWSGIQPNGSSVMGFRRTTTKSGSPN